MSAVRPRGKSSRHYVGRLMRDVGRMIFRLEPVERRILLNGSISGTVFSDYNANGVQDLGEPGLSGWTVFLDTNDNGMLDSGEPSRKTDSNGFYEFANLATPATYNVRQVLQPEYVQTMPGTGGVVLGGAGAGAGANNGSGHGAGSGGGNGKGDAGNGERRFTTTEVVVAFDGKRGKPVLANHLNRDATLRRLVDLPRSADLFTVQNVTLVEVKVPKGIDPMLVVQRFRNLPGVRWAQPNYVYDDFDPREYTPNDPQYPAQAHHGVMKNPLAWDVTLGNPDILIGITDDGVLLNHPDLVDNLWTNPGEIPGNGIDDDGNGFIDDVSGWNFWNNNNNPNPADAANDHGTHVAGVAAARTDNGIGVAGTAGLATIVPIRFYSTSGGSWTSTIVANAYRYAAVIGCHIVNTSYNVDFFSNDSIFAAGLQFMYDAGVLHFNSAGNNGQLNPPRQKWDQSLFVANTQNNDVLNIGSNYGWGVDLSAPGTLVLSTSIGSALDDPNYEIKSGTSMATPNAAAVAALIWGMNPTWTREQVAAQLLGTADNIDAVNPGLAGLLGAGRVNSFRAVSETLAPPRIRSMGDFPADGAVVTSQPGIFTLDVANIFDPATMIASNFELRGAGSDGIFGTADDVLVPLVLSFGASFGSTYMIGTNRLNFAIAETLSPGLYRFAGTSALTDPFGQPIDGNGDGTGGDAFTRTFTLVTAPPKYVVNLKDGQSVAAHFGNHDIAPPRVLSSALTFATAPHRIVIQFNEDVSNSLAHAALALQNLTANAPVDTSGFTFSYDTATNTATWIVDGILPDGRFRATLAAAGITDLSGNVLDGNGDGESGDDHVFEFFFLMGDANHDGTVNLSDFNILAANFGQPDRDFTQGDFNYDGTVNLADFNILAARFGTVLPGGSGADSSGGATAGHSGARMTAAPAPTPAAPFADRSIIGRLTGEADDPMDLLA